MANLGNADFQLMVETVHKIDGRTEAHLLTYDGRVITRDLIEDALSFMTINEFRALIGLPPMSNADHATAMRHRLMVG